MSRTRPPAVATDLAEALGGELVAMGSAGAKAMAVVLGAADVYAHAGGQYEWDSAAPVAVALAAGAARLAASTAARSSTTTPIRTCRTCWSAARCSSTRSARPSTLVPATRRPPG